MEKGEYRVVFGGHGTLARKCYEQIQEPIATVLVELGEEILIELPLYKQGSSYQRSVLSRADSSFLASMYGSWARTWVVDLWKKTVPMLGPSYLGIHSFRENLISRAIAASKTVEDWQTFGAAVHTILQLHGMHAVAAFLDGYES